MELDSWWRTRTIAEAQGEGLHPPQSDLPFMWSNCRCALAVVDWSEGHEPQYIPREHSAEVPTVRERDSDDRCPSTQHCLRAEKAKTLAARGNNQGLRLGRQWGRGVWGCRPTCPIQFPRMPKVPSLSLDLRAVALATRR